MFRPACRRESFISSKVFLNVGRLIPWKNNFFVEKLLEIFDFVFCLCKTYLNSGKYSIVCAQVLNRFLILFFALKSLKLEIKFSFQQY